LKKQAIGVRNEAVAQRERAEAAAREARLNLYAADMMTAQQHLNHGNLGAARKLLDGHAPHSEEDHRGWEWRYLLEQVQGARPVRLEGPTGTVRKLRFSPDGEILASVGGGFCLWDLDRQARSRPWNRPEEVRNFDFTHDGQLGVITKADELLLLDPVTLRALKSFPVPDARTLMFSPVANAAVVEIANAAPIWLDLDTGTSRPLFGGEAVWPCDISDDGTLVCGQAKGDVLVWSVLDQVELARTPMPPGAGYLHDMKFLPGRRALVTTSFNGEPAVLICRNSQWHWEFPFADFQPGERGTSGVAVSAGGGFIAFSSFNHEVSLWSLEDFSRQVRFHGHLDETWSVAVSPDGHTVASGGQDWLVLLWDSRWRPSEQWIEGQFKVSDPVFSHDSRWLALRSQSNRVEVWDLPDHRLVKTLPDAGVPLSFIRGDAGLLTLAGSQLLHWDRETWQPTNAAELGFTAARSPDWPKGSAPLVAAAGDFLVLADTQDLIHVVSLRSGKEVGSIPAQVHALALAPNARWLALADTSQEGMLHLWELLDGKPVKITSRHAHSREIPCLSFSADSRRLASFAADSLAKIWSVEPLELVHELRGHKRGLFGGGFSPDGRTLASVDHLHALNLWHVETGRQLATIEPRAPTKANHDLAQAAFSPDGRYLVAWRKDASCQFWEAPPFEPLAATPSSSR
jgi:WD40 repeat protein